MTKITCLLVSLAVVVLAKASAQGGPSYTKSPLFTPNKSLQRRSPGDVLDTPEWLQDIPEESKVAKYRKRRFLNFPTGSTMQIVTSFIIPLQGIGTSTTFTISLNMNFDLPNNTNIINGRGFVSERLDFYGQIEEFLGGFGYDGRACTLRTICEIAELPLEHGLFGEIINVIMSATSAYSNYLEDNSVTDDYATAEYYGRNHGSCQSFYPECPISLSNALANFVPVFTS